MKAISKNHSINNATHTYMRLFINRRDATHSYLLIHNMHIFNINTSINICIDTG